MRFRLARTRLLFRLTGALLLVACPLSARAAADELGPGPPPLEPVPGLGLRLACGFRVTQYAGEDLANDIYAMTLDARGRIAVTSRGWVKVLEDEDGDGKADRARPVASTKTGGMGLCFDGDDLYFTGDGALSRYRNADGDGRADGRAEPLMKLAFGEHGGHAPRKGPDGWWYVIGGNDAGIAREHANGPGSPVEAPEAGAIIRLSPDLERREVFAHGFRNPYDFDFDAEGEILTYDSDCERDFLLPWYTPTRIYHVGEGLHHGWRLKGYMRSHARRDFYLDTADILWPVGRGSPTGVVCYRHDRFPERYRGGLFALDWTFGKVFFFPLEPRGSTYSTRAEVFLEPIGTAGFAPTDAAVAPDGSLFISIGGRRTRGAVYRIEWAPGGQTAPELDRAADGIESVLHAPQPLDAWSRARWVPEARKLGAGAFAGAVAAEGRSAPERVRAIEVLTELFSGLPPSAARAGARAADPRVRARVAWSLGRKPMGGAKVLRKLAEDPHPRVRRSALEAIRALTEAAGAHKKETKKHRKRSRLLKLGPDDAGMVAMSLGHEDRRVRQAAARLAAALGDEAWKELWNRARTADVPTRLGASLAALWRRPDASCRASVIDVALGSLRDAPAPGHRLDALRLITIALGDFDLDAAAIDVHSSYLLPPSSHPGPKAAARIEEAVSSIFPSGDDRLDIESSRLLAMLGARDAGLAGRVAALLTPESPPSRDIHYLIVLSRLQGPFGADIPARVAGAFLSLGRKTAGLEARPKQTWGPRLSELLRAFILKEPAISEKLLEHPWLIEAGHVELASSLPPGGREVAARRFLEAAVRDPGFSWSEPLIDLLSTLPPAEPRAAIEGAWENVALRDRIVLHLAKSPDVRDREKLLHGVESASPSVVTACLEALESLPPDGSPETLAPLLRLLRRLAREPKQEGLRSRVLALISRQSGRPMEVDGAAGGDLTEACTRIIDELAREFPRLKDALDASGEDLAAFRQTLGAVPWNAGDPLRGEALYRRRGCEACHAIQGALGPSLAGAGRRLSREDLFDAIILPGRDVAPSYRATIFRLKDGQVVSGLAVFESADGWIVQTGASTTARIPTDDVAEKWQGSDSLMPSGLLDGLRPEELADLYAYLRGL